MAFSARISQVVTARTRPSPRPSRRLAASSAASRVAGQAEVGRAAPAHQVSIEGRAEVGQGAFDPPERRFEGFGDRLEPVEERESQAGQVAQVQGPQDRADRARARGRGESSINLGGRHRDRRADQDQVERPGEPPRLDPLAPAPADRGGAVAEEGDVAAQSRREVVEQVRRRRQVPEAIEGVQRGRGVRRSPGQPGAGGDGLEQVDPDPPGAAGGGLEPFGGPDDQVGGAVGQRRVVDPEADPARGVVREGQAIEQVHADHQRLEVVIAVGPPAEDFEEQVQLGGRPDFQAPTRRPEAHWTEVREADGGEAANQAWGRIGVVRQRRPIISS